MANGSYNTGVDPSSSEYGAAATFTPDDSGLQAVATTYLADVKDNTWGVPNGYLTELTAAYGQTNQTLVYMSADPTLRLHTDAALSSVPEPATMAVLSSGMLMLSCVRMRRHSHRTAHAGMFSVVSVGSL
jgi:hypothetical protein